MIDSIIQVLEENLTLYSNQYSYSEKSRLRCANSDFILFLNDMALQNGADCDEATIDGYLGLWKDAFYSNSSSKPRTNQNCISSFFRYLRYLIREEKIHQLNFPSTHKKKTVGPLHLLNKPKLEQHKNLQPDSEDRLTFRAQTNDQTQRGYLHNLSFLEQFTNGFEIAKSIQEYQVGYSYGRQARVCRVFTDFMNYKWTKTKFDGINHLNKEFMEEYVTEYLSLVLNKRGNKSIVAINSDFNALQGLYKHLSRKQLLPSIRFPTPLKRIQRKIPQLKSNHKLLAMALSKTSRRDIYGKEVVSCFSMRERIDEEFLKALERDERYAFNLIRSVCIDEVRQSIKKFNEGQKLIANCDIDYIRNVFKTTGKLLDPNIRGKEDRQILSFFSPEHPNGLSNLLGYYWHEYNGLAFSRAFPGSYFSNTYGSQNIRNWLGLNINNSLAFFIVILGETGVNVSSLENARICDEKNNVLILNSSDQSGYERFEVAKPRAKKYIEKYIKIGGLSEDGEIEINAHTCLDYILRMTAQYRKPDDSRYLWIGPHFAKEPLSSTRIRSTAFKSQLKRLLKTRPEFTGINTSFFTRANIRVSGGVLKWFESGGDLVTVAQYLGNSIDTALNNYIPKPIQETLHRRSIRKFQEYLLVAGTDSSSAPIDKVFNDLSTKKISEIVEDFRSNTNWKRKTKFRKPGTTAEQECKIVFETSAANIAILKIIHSSILELRLSNPTDEQLRVRILGKAQGFWIELWNVINVLLRNSADRGLKRSFNEGVVLADQITSNSRDV